eukprot:2731185-Pleurochrysis_carterae.AAC.3
MEHEDALVFVAGFLYFVKQHHEQQSATLDKDDEQTETLPKRTNQSPALAAPQSMARTAPQFLARRKQRQEGAAHTPRSVCGAWQQEPRGRTGREHSRRQRDCKETLHHEARKEQMQEKAQRKPCCGDGAKQQKCRGGTGEKQRGEGFCEHERKQRNCKAVSKHEARRRQQEHKRGPKKQATAPQKARSSAGAKQPNPRGVTGDKKTRRGFCEHGRRKRDCKECDSSISCDHGRIRRFCKECGGASICEHGRQRASCKECGGAGICEHGRRRSQCKECGGSAFCEHGRRRCRCAECDGTSICEHSRILSQCKECGGTSFCAHGRRRSACKKCRTTETIRR